MSVIGAVGIDLGSQYCVIAATKTGGVEILTNDLSNRLTPNIVSFGDKQRFIGEAGLSKLNTNFRNTVLFFNRFLGLSAEYPSLQQEAQWLTSKLVPLPDNKLGHEVRYLGENFTFTTERVVAMMLSHAKEICQKAAVSMSDVVISVPSYYTEKERRALLDALTIAEIKPARIINETTASALSYGIFRQKEFTEQPKYVAFADLGHSKFSVAIVKFTKDRLHVLAKACDRHLGGRDFDWIIMQHFAGLFSKKHHINPLENPRSRLKLSTAAEKMRKVLSANPDAHISIDCLLEEFDLTGSLTRDAFSSMTADLQARIYSICKGVLRKSGLDRVESVEIIGGGCRMPIVQRILAEAFSVQDVSRTMNNEEAVARGCAVQAAMLSPLFKVRDFGVQDINMNPIEITICDLPPVIQPQSELLFSDTNIFPVVKVLNLQKKGPFKITLDYSDKLPAGLDRRVAEFIINTPEEPELYKVKVSLKMNIHGVVLAESAHRVEETYEENPAEPSKPKRNRKKIPLEIHAKYQGLSNEEISDYLTEEARMIEEDRLIRETLDKKNELESYVYEWRDKLQGSLKSYETPERIHFIMQQLQAAEDWLYSDGADTSKSVYTEKLLELREFTDPVIYRFNAYTHLPTLISDLETTINQCAGVIYSEDPQYATIAPQDKEAIILRCQESGEWLSRVKESLKGAQICNNPGFNVEDLVKRTISLKEFTQSIILKYKTAS